MTRHRPDGTRELPAVTQPVAARPGVQRARPARRPFWPHTWRDAMYMAATLVLLAVLAIVLAAAWRLMGH